MDVTLPKSEAEMLNGARERESLAGLATGQSLASGAGGRCTAACIVSAGTPKPWGAPPLGGAWITLEPRAPLGIVALTGKWQDRPSPSRKMGRNATFCKVP